MARNETARHLRDAVRRLMVAHGALDETRRPCGTPLSLAQAHALLELLHQDGGMTVSELASKLAIDRTNVSRLCARMEEAGELVRGPHPGDGRARALRLTAAGKKLARRVDASSARHFARLVGRLGDSAKAIVEALQVLEATMTAMEER